MCALLFERMPHLMRFDACCVQAALDYGVVTHGVDQEQLQQHADDLAEAVARYIAHYPLD